jgi:hypothetical protein
MAAAANTRTVRNHTTAVAYLVARRAELLAQAELATDMAELYQSVSEGGDLDWSVEQYLGQAREAMAQVARIDACRVGA